MERHGTWQLVGVEYAMPGAPGENPFPGARWHEHEASCHYRDYREVAAASAGECPPRHPESGAEFVQWHPALAVVHVWAWYPNPDGPFAEQNPYLTPYEGELSTEPGHHHGGLSGTEVAYSEFNHRSAGAFLVLLAGVIVWESRRPRPFPWSALSAALWMVFGIYLFVWSDPEAWPWGPKGFADIFTDATVWQHKVLTLIPIAIGVVEGLRQRGHVLGAGWRYLFPSLGVLGGATLFFHVHDGRVHLDWIYLQHAAMGLLSLGVGTTLLLARRGRDRGRIGLGRTWPALLFVLGLVLLFYSEA